MWDAVDGHIGDEQAVMQAVIWENPPVGDDAECPLAGLLRLGGMEAIMAHILPRCGSDAPRSDPQAGHSVIRDWNGSRRTLHTGTRRACGHLGMRPCSH